MFRKELLGDLDETRAIDRLCELNVMEQVSNVARTTIIQEAWGRGQPVSVHGWIYGLHGGLLQDLKVTVHGNGKSEAPNPKSETNSTELSGQK